MPGGDSFWCHQDERLFPPSPDPSQHDPEQLLWGGESSAMSFGMESEQLLTQSEIFEDEILAGTERTNNPAEQVPEPHNHGKNLNETPSTEMIPKSLTFQVHDVLITRRAILIPTANLPTGLDSGST